MTSRKNDHFETPPLSLPFNQVHFKEEQSFYNLGKIFKV